MIRSELCHFHHHDLSLSFLLSKLEFFAGLGPLATVMDVATKLQFSLEVYDHKKSGRLSKDDLMTVLSGEYNALKTCFLYEISHDNMRYQLR